MYGVKSMGENSEKKGFSGLSVQSKVEGFLTIVVIACTIVLFSVLYYRYLVPVYIVCMIISVIALFATEILLFWRPRRFSVFLTVVFIGLMAILITSSLLIPWNVDSSDSRSYKENMRYMKERGYSVLFFPDQVPEDAEGYDLEFRSGRFSGQGQVFVEYCCTQSAMAGYQMKVEKMAILGPLTVKESQSMTLPMEMQAQMAEAFGVEEESVTSFDFKTVLPEDIDDHPDTQVYIMSCELDKENPKTEAILIDVSSGWVCFSRLF